MKRHPFLLLIVLFSSSAAPTTANVQPVVYEYGEGWKITASMIFIHGLGDTEQGFLNIWKRALGTLPGLRHIRFVLPRAKRRPVECCGVTTSWMDLPTLPVSLSLARPKLEYVEASVATIHDLIDAQVAAGISPERIFVGGFSQGGALTLASTIRYRRRIGGAVVLSGWALKSQDLGERIGAWATEGLASPIFVGHGTADPTVLPECGADVVTKLLAPQQDSDGGQQAIVDVTDKTNYADMGHTVSPEVIRDVATWLSARLRMSEEESEGRGGDGGGGSGQRAAGAAEL